jgi:zinc transport system ATP-binding protein
MSAEIAISMNQASFAYSQNEVVLDQVNLSVPAGAFMAVLGPNGGGKTTLLKLLLGVLTPNSGQIRIFGRPPAVACHRVGYVPQYCSANFTLPMSVLEAVLMGRLNREPRLFGRHWAKSKEQSELARQALEQVGLGELEARPISSLSGGQRQRLFIARALSGSPDILLLDEPTANIDPQGKFCFYEFLAGLAGPKTVLMVSHDLSLVSEPLNYIAIVNNGTIITTTGGELTPEILVALYGRHSHDCALNRYLGALTGTSSKSPPEQNHTGKQS